MPRRLARACRKAMCPRTATDQSGFCEPHRQQHRRAEGKERDRHRPSARQRGYTWTWEKARARWLLEHPLCAECERQGRITAANEVDHIIPHRGDMDLFWREDTWQSLCKPCHDAKSAREAGGWGKR